MRAIAHPVRSLAFASHVLLLMAMLPLSAWSQASIQSTDSAPSSTSTGTGMIQPNQKFCPPDDLDLCAAPPPPEDVRNAQFGSATPVSAMLPGETKNVSVQMVNNGNVTWTAAGNFRLGSQNPGDNTTWGVNRVNIVSDVAPGQTGTFNFTIKAPSAPGVYNYQWRMVQDGVMWFGGLTPNMAVKVVSGSISATPNPCNIAAGSGTCTSTVNWTSSSNTSEVWVSNLDGSAPQLFARAQYGPQSAPWIQSHGHRFTLKSDGLTLGSVDVRGNQPPNISWSSVPISGSTFVAPTSITLGVLASDPDGSVQRVEFWVDGTRLTTVTAAPYQILWNNVVAGSHAMQAVAYDNLGNAGWSSTSAITVRNSVIMGNVDGVSSGGVVTGWACSSYLAQSIPVHLYLGGPAGSGTFIGSYPADQASEPAVANACGVGSGSYRYRIQLSDTQRIQYGGKTIHIHGISPVGGSNDLLGGSGNFTVPLFVRNAQYVGQTVSATMLTGRTQQVSVQMKNNGDYTWSAGTNFRLGSQNPVDNGAWGTGRAYLASDVAPGQTAMFNFTIIAPAMPGSYNFQWRMLQEGVAWFGDVTPNVSIVVSTPPPVVSSSASIDYDELGRVIALRDSAGRAKLGYEYDANGNVTKITNALNHATRMTYDALDRVSTSTDAAGQVTAYQYDVASRLIKVTDARGHATSYSYDGFGQLWQQVSPDTGTTTFAYDAYGLPLSTTRANGVTTTYGYDALYRRTSVSAGGAQQWAAYDNCTGGIGRLCSTGDAAGTTSYSYTPEGQVAGRGFSIAGTTYALGYSYDGAGRLAAVAYPDGNRATYSYANGRVSGVAMIVGGVTSNVASAVTYQPDGAMASWISSNGLANALAYDGDGRLAGISVPGVQNLAFAYDDADRISRITNGIDGALTQSFGYDALSRLTSVASAASNESYQYDATGNRIGQTINGVFTPSTIEAASNRLMTFGATTYGYDANGNLTTVAGAPRYHYDAFNRMDSAAGTSYHVNPEGQRLRKSGSAGISYFAQDPSNAMLSEYSGGWIDYVWLNGRLVGRVAGGQFYAVHSDQVGRPEVVTNGAKVVVWRAQNFAFTQNVVTAGIAFNLGFPGQYYDAETGLWNNGYRDYDSKGGRYVQSDPIGLAGGVNTYAYVEGNPLIYTDPFGLASASGAMADCLAQIFGQSVADVNIRNKTFVRNDFVTTRKNSIRLPQTLSIDEFFADHGLVLHEYYHVLRQWNTGGLTRRGYLAEVARSGSWADGNRFEDAANEFSRNNIQAFNDCMQHKSEKCSK